MPIRNDKRGLGGGSIIAIVGAIIVIMLLVTAMGISSNTFSNLPGGTNSTEQVADYIIFKASNALTASKNCSNNRIDFVSTNASRVIQETIDTLEANGGSGIYIKPGDYYCDWPINISKPIKLEGAGVGDIWYSNISYYGTRLIGTLPDTSLLTIDGTGTQFGPTIMNLGLWGVMPDAHNYTGAGTGLNITSTLAGRCLIKNVAIYGFENYGVDVGGAYHSATFENCWIASNGKGSETHGGVILTNANLINFVNCQIEWNGVGVLPVYGYGTNFIGCAIEGNDYDGVNSTNSSYYQHLTLDNCQFEVNNVLNLSGKMDINIGSGDAYWGIKNAKFAGTTVQFAIYNAAWYTQLYNLRTISSPTIHFTNNLKGSVIDCYNIDPNCVANMSTIDVLGSALQTCGQTTIYSGTLYADVTHGLLGAPTVILLTGTTNVTKELYAVNVTATTFQIYYNQWQPVITTNTTVYWWARV